MKLFIVSKKQHTKTAIAILAYNMDLSRLIATAFEHNINVIDKISILNNKRIEHFTCLEV
jgi:hypothetical protein